MDSNRKRELLKVTRVGFALNIVLTCFKLFAGIVGKSAAMIADAIHSISDILSDVIVLVFINISSKPKDENHRYGHGKFETFATFSVGVILAAVGFAMLYSSGTLIYKIFDGKIIDKPGKIAIWAAAVSILIKEILFWYTYKLGKKQNSNMIIANAWHHRSDALSSVATLIGISGAIFLGEKFRILDPIAAALVSFFIIRVAYNITKPAFNELLEQSLPVAIEKEIIEIACSVSVVEKPHNIRTRKIGNSYAIEIHIRLPNKLTVESSHEIVEKVETKLREKYGENTHIAIHVDPSIQEPKIND